MMSNSIDKILQAQHHIEQLEKSLEYCYESLEIYPQRNFPEKWEKIQHDLKKVRQLLEWWILKRRQSSVNEYLDYDYDCGRKSVSTHFKDLIGANLSGANMACRDLRCADLTGIDLSKAKLVRILLNHANLSGANLQGVNIRSSDLTGVNLTGANLSDAYLSCTLNFANLSGAMLRDADSWADWVGANLSNADVTNTQFAHSRGLSPSLKQDLISRGAIFDEF
jgi:hypothetical protein